MPEGTGRELEKLRNDQKVSVDVAVAERGRAALKRLLVDGEVAVRGGAVLGLGSRRSSAADLPHDLAREGGQVHRPARRDQVAIDDCLAIFPYAARRLDVLRHAVVPERREVALADDIRRGERPRSVADRRHGLVRRHERARDGKRPFVLAHRGRRAIGEPAGDEQEFVGLRVDGVEGCLRRNGIAVLAADLVRGRRGHRDLPSRSSRRKRGTNSSKSSNRSAVRMRAFLGGDERA